MCKYITISQLESNHFSCFWSCYLLVCDVSWNASIIENFYIRTEYLISYYHRITCGISYYDLLAHERPAPQHLRERCRGVEARSVNSCCCWIFSSVKKTFRPKGMDVLSRCILSSRGPIWICVFLGKAKIFVAKSGSIIFFIFFFLQKPSSYHSPWNNWELGWRHQDALIHLERIVLRLQGWCDGVNFLRPFRSCTANCCIFLGRNYGPFSSA